MAGYVSRTFARFDAHCRRAQGQLVAAQVH